MEMKKQRWQVLKLDHGWQAVLPDTDTEPHANFSGDWRELPLGTELNLANETCPCKPKIDFLNKIIIHNSFQDKNRVEESLRKIGI